MTTTDPTSGSIDGNRSADSIDAADIVKRLRATFDRGRTRSIEWRVAQLDGLARMLTENEARFVEALRDDLGKPEIEAYAADVKTTYNEVVHLRKNLAAWAEPRKASVPMAAQPGKAWVQPEPLGVALVIAPWNYPVQLLVQPMAAALAAGNAVVGKPSELAPATSVALAELMPRYTAPDAVAVVEGGVDASTALLAERYDHIFFTGSTAVGRVVMKAAAEHLTPVTLELGGKSPVLVDDSADIAVAGRRIAWGKWLNAGQTCIAPDYALVTAERRDELVESLRVAFDQFAGSGPVADSPDFARIVNDRHVDRLTGLLADHGGVTAVGGSVDAASRFVEPTVVVDPDPTSPLMSEEIFGPILPLLTVDSMDDAVALVNSREKPLALYAFGDVEVARSLVDRTTSGGACINHVIVQLTAPELPFGGVGHSGIGRSHGRASFDAFSNLRAVMQKQPSPDPSLMYPPYTKFRQKVVRTFL